MEPTTTEIIKLSSDESLKKFEALKASVNSKVAEIDKIEITTPESLAVANMQLSSAKKIENLIEEKRTEIKKPALDFGKQVDKAAKDLVTPLNTSTEKLKAKMLVYDTAEKEKQKKELEALEAQKKAQEQIIAGKREKFAADAIAAINEAKTVVALSSVYVTYIKSYPPEYGPDLRTQLKLLGIQKQKSLLGEMNNYDDSYKKAIGAPIDTPVVMTSPALAIIEEKKVAVETAGSGVNIRKTWVFEVVDRNAVPQEWLTIDEEKVKEYMKNNKDTLAEGQIVTGIKFFQKSSVVTK